MDFEESASAPTRARAGDESNAPARDSLAPAARTIDVRLDDRDTQRLLERQGTINIWLDVVVCGTPSPDRSSRLEAMISLTRQSVLAILDAERRNAEQRGLDESAAEIRARLERRQALTPLDRKSYHRLWNGGQMYDIPYGEFPLFDLLCNRSSRAASGITADAVPLEELLALAERALSYRPR